jgi:hypothetical protein
MTPLYVPVCELKELIGLKKKDIELIIMGSLSFNT